MIVDCDIAEDVIIPHPELVNLYGCKIGSGCKIASFVEIQRGVTIGKNCKIEAFAFIPTGVTLEDGVFIGPHVCFTNDSFPRAVAPNGALLSAEDWILSSTLVCSRASVGANSTILCGVTIGQDVMIGAGSLVTKDIPDRQIWFGNPAKYKRTCK